MFEVGFIQFNLVSSAFPIREDDSCYNRKLWGEFLLSQGFGYRVLGNLTLYSLMAREMYLRGEV